MASARGIAEQLLAIAGVEVGGTQPWDLQLHDNRVFSRVIAKGSLGLGESYMDGWWDSQALDQFFTKVLNAHLDRQFRLSWPAIVVAAKAILVNLQSNARAFEVGEKHYDIGNDLYEKMLDKRMVYSCGYWSSPTHPAKNLDDAQEQKLDLVCRKIGLKKGDCILDIGCGWGSFAKYAAEKYGASVVGVTVSREQATLARERCKGLPVEIRVQDYRELNEKFDHIISIGMFEHVGYKNYRAYFEVAHRCLKPSGKFLLHTIGQNFSSHNADIWTQKYIFPNGMLPSTAQIGKGVENLFVIEDWHNFGPDYDKTLMQWFKNFDAAWPALKDKYGERFYRMWKYYLMTSAAAFRSRSIQLWQLVLTKDGQAGGYQTVR